MSDRNIMTFKQPTVAESRAELAQALRSMAHHTMAATVSTMSLDEFASKERIMRDAVHVMVAAEHSAPCNCYYWMLKFHQCKAKDGQPVLSREKES